jgi:hypothetical protein
MTKPSDSPPLPDWAIEHARVALRIGRSAPDIERHLVARGLTPEAADSVVTNLLDEQTYRRFQFLRRSDRRKLAHRIASGIVFSAYVVYGYHVGGVRSVLETLAGFALPMACIWFGDLIGSYWRFFTYFGWTTFSYGGPTPDIVVRLVGWLVLLLPAIVLFVLVLMNPRR